MSTMEQVQSRPRTRTRLDLDRLPPALQDGQAVANAKHIAELERESFCQQHGGRLDADGRLGREHRVADRRGRHV